MNSLEKLVTYALVWAVIFASVGKLPSIVVFFAQKAMSAQQEGLVSLTALNKTLIQGGKRKVQNVSNIR